MSTHRPGFQTFFSFFTSFCIGQISHQQQEGCDILDPRKAVVEVTYLKCLHVCEAEQNDLVGIPYNTAFPGVTVTSALDCLPPITDLENFG